jgi:hypothetical protein
VLQQGRVIGLEADWSGLWEDWHKHDGSSLEDKLRTLAPCAVRTEKVNNLVGAGASFSLSSANEAA